MLKSGNINMMDYNIGEKYLDKFISVSKIPSIKFDDFDEFSYFGQDHIWEPKDDDAQNLFDLFKDWAKAINSLINPELDEELEGVGDFVRDHDEVMWNPSNTLSTYTESTQVPPQYNVLKAIEVIEKNAHSKSTHRCALYVRRALNAGGVPITGKGNANGYGTYFKKSKQWTEINPKDVLPGDLCFIRNSKNGHLAMWTGKLWISDYKLNGPHVYNTAKDGVNTFYFRYTG